MDGWGIVTDPRGRRSYANRGRRAEQAVQANEVRLRFLDDLSVQVATSDDADQILATTTRMLAQHLGLSNCANADMDEDEAASPFAALGAPGSPSIVGHYILADFGELAVRNLHAGLPLVINDDCTELSPH